MSGCVPCACSWHVDNLELFQRPVAQETPTNPHLGPPWPGCRKRQQQTTAEQCSQTQQTNIVPSYAADEWLSHTDGAGGVDEGLCEQAWTRVRVCVCVGLWQETKQVVASNANVSFLHTHVYAKLQRHTHTHTKTGHHHTIAWMLQLR